MSIKETAKNNIGKIAFGSVGTIVTLVTALFTVDARYAHSADVNKDKINTQDLIQDTTQTLRRQMLEDKLFELDVKKAQAKDQKLPPVESALHARFARQLNDINATQTRNRMRNQTLPQE